MTPRQQRFVEEYLIDLNATQAAIRAGYSKKCAKVEGHRLLTYAAVSEAVAKKQQKRLTSLAVSGERVVTELSRIGFADLTKAVYVEHGCLIVKDTADIPEDLRPAIAEISETVSKHGRTIKVRLHDKVAALLALAKHTGVSEAPEKEPPSPDEVEFVDGPGPE
jgi:phage terminase small subunit